MKKSLATVLLVAGVGAYAAPRVIYNHDCTEFTAVTPDEKMTEKGAREYLDAILDGGAVTDFFANPNAQMAFFDSKVFERFVDADRIPGVDAASHGCFKRMKLLAERGIDFIDVWRRRCAERDVRFWISMRMNDIHSVDDPRSPLVCTWWRQHPECRRRPGYTSGSWHLGALDYSQEPVFQRHLAFFRELVDRYDAFGYELDWLRFPHHLPVGRERESAHVLTAFMRAARAIANAKAAERGHPILLAARVASTPEAALSLGTDAEAWARERLVDLVIPCNFFTTADFTLPLADWKRRIAVANPAVAVVPGVDSGVVKGTERQFLTADEYRGWMERLYAAGADGFYFFNLFHFKLDSPQMRLINADGGPTEAKVRAGSRTYPITWLDATGDSFRERRQLPAVLDSPCSLRVPIGRPVPGDAVEVRLAFASAVDAGFGSGVLLNGQAPSAVELIPAREWLCPEQKAGASLRFRYPSAAVRPGNNAIAIPAARGQEVIAAELALLVRRP